MVSIGSIFLNASSIHSFSFPSSSTFTSTSMNDVIEVWITKELRDAKNSSSTCKFKLMGCASVSWISNKEIFFFPFFFEVLLLVVDDLAIFFLSKRNHVYHWQLVVEEQEFHSQSKHAHRLLLRSYHSLTLHLHWRRMFAHLLWCGELPHSH